MARNLLLGRLALLTTALAVLATGPAGPADAAKRRPKCEQLRGEDRTRLGRTRMFTRHENRALYVCRVGSRAKPRLLATGYAGVDEEDRVFGDLVAGGRLIWVTTVGLRQDGSTPSSLELFATRTGTLRASMDTDTDRRSFLAADGAVLVHDGDGRVELHDAQGSRYASGPGASEPGLTRDGRASWTTGAGTAASAQLDGAPSGDLDRVAEPTA